MDALKADIFCRIVDNFGDIGVCWRLARRLAHGHGWRVRLWVDDLGSFARLVPDVAGISGHGQVQGIEIVHWQQPMPSSLLSPGDVVIEAFACDPPPDFVSQLGKAQVWLNLEYLSAEAWIESCHGLPSPQPGGLLKYFFFPGFTPGSGGLLREPGLLQERDAFQACPQTRIRFLVDAGVPEALANLAMDGQADLVSVFCYPDAPVSQLHGMLAQRDRAAVLLLAGGAAPYLAAGAHGAAHVVRLPFFSQEGYDRLLWAADVNFVRGEDSFVRAQWAGKPLVWHIYPQQDAAHIDKLSSWLARYPTLPQVAAAHGAWNGECAPDDVGPALAAALDADTLREWGCRARDWSLSLARNPELADAVATFCRHRLI